MGIFYANGDTQVIHKLIKSCEGWQSDTLIKQQNVDKFYIAKIVRDKLLTLTTQHPHALKLCKKEMEGPNLLQEDKALLHGILELIARHTT